MQVQSASPTKTAYLKTTKAAKTNLAKVMVKGNPLVAIGLIMVVAPNTAILDSLLKNQEITPV